MRELCWTMTPGRCGRPPAHSVSDCVLDLTLTEGKYHQVKRMLAAVGNRVEALHRWKIGNLVLPEDLPLGQWRWLTARIYRCWASKARREKGMFVATFQPRDCQRGFGIFAQAGLTRLCAFFWLWRGPLCGPGARHRQWRRWPPIRQILLGFPGWIRPRAWVR